MQYRRALSLAVLLLTTQTPAVPGGRATPVRAFSPDSTRPERSFKSYGTALGVSWAKHALQGYSMKLWLSNNMALGLEAGVFAQVPPTDCGGIGIGLEYPVGGCIEHLYGAGPWIGGIVDGVRRVDEAYNGDDGRHEFEPERKDTSRDKIWHTHLGSEQPDLNGYSGYYLFHGIQVNRRGVDDDGDGKVDEDELDGLDNDGDWNPITDDLGADGLPDSLEVSCDGTSYNPLTNPDPNNDNYDTAGVDKCHLDSLGNYRHKDDRALYTQNNGLPDHGEPHVDEDYGAISDNDLYFSATDTFRSITFPGHIPMGIKVFAKSYAWQSMPEPILPFEYEFINVGTKVVRQVYLGFFVDADIGPVSEPYYYTHNFAGYYGDLYTGYEHNCVDRGSTPLGLTLLGSSRPLDSLSVQWHWHGFSQYGDIDSVIYGWMTGEAFAYPIGLNQLCTSPTDTRFFYSFGPFGDLAPRETLRCSVALVSGDVLDIGPNSMRQNVKKAFYWHQRNYYPQAIPPSPPLRLESKNKSIMVSWQWRAGDPGIDPIENWDEHDNVLDGLPDTNWRKRNPPPGISRGGRNFEGFRLWRSEASAPSQISYALLGEYRIDDDSLFGYHSGIKFSYVDSSVRPGTTYWYSVTSFSVAQTATIPFVDSAGMHHIDTVQVGSLESPLGANSKYIRVNFGPSTLPGQAKVVPNPYRGDYQYTDGNGFEGRELTWSDAKRVIWFIDLPARATIRVFTVAGDVITTIQHDDAARGTSGLPVGQEEWNLFSESGRPIASGLYIFTVESVFGQQTGKFVVIR